MRWWPRTIRWQMLAGLVLLEALSLALFAALLIRQQGREAYRHAQQRLASQAASVALQAKEALLQQRPGWVGLSVKMMGEAASEAFAMGTEPAGNALFVSQGGADLKKHDAAGRAQIPLATPDEPRIFTVGRGQWEGVKPIYTGSDLRGFAWVKTDPAWDVELRETILRGTILFGVIWMAASGLLVLLMAGSISRPLAILHRGTRALMTSPETGGSFPLPVTVHNEIGDRSEERRVGMRGR